MLIVNTLAPLVLLIVLGGVLAKYEFLGHQFMADLNKLAFWIALPALLFTSANHATEPGSQTWTLIALLFGATILITLIAWGVSYLLKMPDHTRGTLAQSAMRGNLAYIGIPVLAYSFSTLPGKGDNKAMATAVIVMVLLMAFYNVMAVIVLQLSHHSAQGADWRKVGKSVVTNPLLVAGILGLIVPLVNVTLPEFVQRALEALGAAAVPIALMCIGGSLATTSLKGRVSWVAAAALLKVGLLPFLVFWVSRWVGLKHDELRIAVVLSCCPTAAASFIMAKQMGGDAALASGSIALSTVLSAGSLAVVLWVTS